MSAATTPLAPMCTQRFATRDSWRQRRRPLTPRDGVCIGALLASHIGSRKRLAYLRLCLESISQQEDAPECLVVSWYADDSLAAEVAALFKTLKLPRVRLRVLRQPQRLSQYGHLREALAAFELEAPRGAAGAAASWLLFSDDDDIWHPKRVQFARLACADASPSSSAAAPSKRKGSAPQSSGNRDGRGRTNALAFGTYAYPIEDAGQEARTAQEVHRLLDTRHCAIWLGASEIFQYAVRPDILREFVRHEAESVLSHRFADVRFAQYMKHERGGVRELNADDLMQLDGRQPASEREKSAWLVRHWMYFYRNKRQLNAATWMGDLDDLRAYQEGAARAEAARKAATDGRTASDYDRASTGQQPHSHADLVVARRVLQGFGKAPSKAAARQEEESVTAEVARMRHHAELTAMMCLQFRNAAELAVAICRDADPSGGKAAPAGTAEGQLQKKLLKEQERLIVEALHTFEHPRRRDTLPMGDVAACLS